MKTALTLVVTRCFDCPFYENEWSVCTRTPSLDFNAFPSHRDVPHPQSMKGMPEWCPLRQGGILVVVDPTEAKP